jgi:hypothetical protein
MLLHLKSLAGTLPSVELPADATIRDLKRLIHHACPGTVGKRLRLLWQPRAARSKKGSKGLHAVLPTVRKLYSSLLKNFAALEMYILDRVFKHLLAEKTPM